MDITEPSAVQPVNDSSLSKTQRRGPLYQIMACKTFSIQRAMQVVHRVAHKSYRRVCQLFCCPTDDLLCQEFPCCLGIKGQSAMSPTEGRDTKMALLSPPSTILIVNISNSVLTDCVIGNNTYSSAVSESQPLMQKSEFHVFDQTSCGCSHRQHEAAQSLPPPPSPPPPPPSSPSADPANINIYNSNLNYAIIGDNNYMYSEQNHSTEPEEQQL